MTVGAARRLGPESAVPPVSPGAHSPTAVAAAFYFTVSTLLYIDLVAA
jgi:hypothetical protein